MGRWREAPEGPSLVLPIYGEVARSAGGAWQSPPHSWGGGAKRRRGPIPRLRRVLPRKRGRQAARSAGGAPSPGFAGYFPASGEDKRREAPEGPHPPASPGTSPQAGKTSGAKRRRGPIPRLRRVLPRKRGRQLALADPL